MGLESWLRGKARSTVDGLFCSSSPEVQRVGDRDSGWVMNTTPQLAVCYCAGVGKGMSFELALARIAAKPVLVFDPSPTGIATVEKSDTFNLKFFPVGLAADAGVVEFSLPLDPGEGSYSVGPSGRFSNFSATRSKFRGSFGVLKPVSSYRKRRFTRSSQKRTVNEAFPSSIPSFRQ
jgi:hypothetical protein